MDMIRAVVEGRLQGQGREQRPKVQIGVRISADHADILDALAERLKAPRGGLAIELLEAAIIEAGRLLGVEAHQDGDGFVEVMLFEDPREPEEAEE